MVVPVPRHGESLYISAKEAAAELGVSIPTLYAYVSRGFIRSQGVAGSRNRRYWKVDIERLKISSTCQAIGDYRDRGQRTAREDVLLDERA